MIGAVHPTVQQMTHTSDLIGVACKAVGLMIVDVQSRMRAMRAVTCVTTAQMIDRFRSL